MDTTNTPLEEWNGWDADEQGLHDPSWEQFLTIHSRSSIPETSDNPETTPSATLANRTSASLTPDLREMIYHPDPYTIDPQWHEYPTLFDHDSVAMTSFPQNSYFPPEADTSQLRDQDEFPIHQLVEVRNHVTNF
jgi:hypothetical protein